jgi:hypothetical protein
MPGDVKLNVGIPDQRRRRGLKHWLALTTLAAQILLELQR